MLEKKKIVWRLVYFFLFETTRYQQENLRILITKSKLKFDKLIIIKGKKTRG